MVDASHGFGQSALFGQPSNDPNMNLHYLNQAHACAVQNPTNVQAQRQWAYWAEIVQRQAAAHPPQPQPPYAVPTGPSLTSAQGPDAAQAPGAPPGISMPAGTQGSLGTASVH